MSSHKPFRPRWWLFALWVLTTAPWLTRLARGGFSHDIELFWTSASAMLHGATPYVDIPFEYPPYALFWFLGPAALSDNIYQFRVAFGLVIWAIDASLKGVFLWRIPRAAGRASDLLPFGVYVLATAAIGQVLLQRYDVIPAALSFAALLALTAGWAGTAGGLIAIAVGTKIYPALFIPVMAVHAWRRSRPDLIRFATGALVMLLPLLILAWWMPWWRFVALQTNRGLQVESTWASIVWLLHFGGVPAGWELTSAWYEVTGPMAAWLVGPARVIWILATCAGLVRATQVAWHLPVASPALLSSLALLMLLPAVPFVAFSLVLSPQFHIWLLPWCVLALAVREPPGFDARPARRAAWCILFSTVIVRVFYPSSTYTTGLDAGRTMVLMLRNGLLVYSFVCLWVSARRAILVEA